MIDFEQKYKCLKHIVEVSHDGVRENEGNNVARCQRRLANSWLFGVKRYAFVCYCGPRDEMGRSSWPKETGGDIAMTIYKMIIASLVSVKKN